MASKKSDDPVHTQERKHLLAQLEQLETTYKSGILPHHEFTTAKKSLEKRIQAIDQKIKQQEAKKKAVEEILGAQSVLGSGTTKKKHVKYFTPVEAVMKKETVHPKKAKKGEKEEKQEQPSVEIIPAEEPIAPYKEIDTLVEQNDTNWRFALALLTVFLLILLYIKFVSFGGTADVVSLDVYLDYASPYSHEMFTVLQDVVAAREEAVYVTYHILGASEQSRLAGYAVLCANAQERKDEFVTYLFSQEVMTLTDESLVTSAETLGLDSTVFSSCMHAETTAVLYEQEQAAAVDIPYTPTIVINNKKIVGAVDAATLSTVLDEEITALG